MKSIYKKLLVAHPERLSEEYFYHCYCGQKLPGNEKGFISLLENVLTFSGWKNDLNIAHRLRQLSIPADFIWGEKDVFEKPHTGLKKARVIKNHRFEIVEDAGHAIWLDQPELCVELILSMFKNDIHSQNEASNPIEKEI